MKISNLENIRIHPTAEVYTTQIGEGTMIWQFVVILPEAVLGKECNVNAHVLIENKVKIGDRVTIKPGVYLWDGLTVEDDVMIGPNVTFTNDKYPRSKNKNFHRLDTKLYKGCSIGAGSILMAGLEIGSYAMVAAGSLVTKNVPNHALVMGNPAKIVGWVGIDGIPMKPNDELWIDSNGEHWKVIEGKLNKQ
jgi:UDP-2-acetamido-3-amino-2,3-dideoxy-glucuronate N-acetyltransferase